MDPGSSCVLTLDTPLATHPAMVDTVVRVGFNAVWLVVDGWLRVGAWTQFGGTCGRCRPTSAARRSTRRAASTRC